MQAEVTCPRCLKEFTEANPPRLLTACGHTFCEKCLTDIAVPHEEGKIKITCPDCAGGVSHVILERVTLLPKNLALTNFLDARKNNTSTRSINSLKDQSFNVPKLNQSYHEEDEDEALMTAIDGKETHSQKEQGPRKKERILTTPVLLQKLSEGENELCLLHNKQIQLVCLVDHQRLCSKCALFGQHRGHEFVSLDQVEQGNKKIQETLLEIFDEKSNILDQYASKSRREKLLSLLTHKTSSMKKEISDKFKKIQDEIVKTEKAIYHKLQEIAQNVERKIKKLLVLDQKTINIYESWTIAAEKRFNSYQSGTHEAILDFYLNGKGLIDSGKDIIINLKRQQEKSTEQANKFVDELGVFFNDTPCLTSLAKIVQLYENQRQLEKKLGSAFAQKENSKLFANCEFSYQNIKKRVNTQAHDDDESLLQLVDEFQQNHNHSALTTNNILNDSMIKLEKTTPTKMTRPSIHGTPSSKPVPKKRPSAITKQLPTHKQVPKQQKKEVVPRQAVKKKMRAIKLPEKYEKMMEGVLSDSVETVDFTNAQLGDAISFQLCQLMKSNTRSRNLKLIRNKITDDGFAKIMPLLTGFSSINLSQNLLTQNCLNFLTEHRAAFPNLKTLILIQNKIAQRKCKLVVQKLRKMDLAISI